MRLALPLVVLTCVSASAMEVVVPNPGNGPGQPGSGGMPIGTAMSRPAMACEVELVVITSEKDQAGLARWAELAAAGYRLSQVTTVGVNQWL